MMDHIAKLQRRIGASREVPPTADWVNIEAEIGLQFPRSYKELCGRYHGLEFDHFLLVGNVAESYRHGVEMNEVRQTLEILSDLTENEGSITGVTLSGETSEWPVYPYYPASGGLYPWGSTSNGDMCFWRTAPVQTDWSIVVTGGGLWFEYDVDIVEFLLRVMDNDVHAFPALDCSEGSVEEFLLVDGQEKVAKRSLLLPY